MEYPAQLIKWTVWISGFIATFYLFVERCFQIAGGVTAADLSSDMTALNHYPHQAVYLAPYGQLWYWINLGLPHSTGLEWTLSIAALDVPVSLFFLWKSWNLWIVYIFVSVLSFTSTPYNMPVLWATGLGMFWLPLAALGPLIKIPDTDSQLSYILSWSVRQPDNWFYYSLMVIWTIAVLLNSQTFRLKRATWILVHWAEHKGG